MLSFYATASLLILVNYVNCVPFPKDAISFHPDDSIRNFHDATAGEQTDTNITYLLPQTVQPTSYIIKMVPELQGRFNFSGTVTIACYPKIYTKNITLHSNGLEIREVTVTSNGWLQRSTYELRPESQLLIINMMYELTRFREYVVTIKFEGLLNDRMQGFYRSYYKIGNKKRWLATTQFEPTYARMAFPCFDEPRFKTPFKIAVGHYENETAISNTPPYSVSTPDHSINNRIWTTFQWTDILPTYLVAFIVSPFHNVTNSYKNFTIWAREGAINQGLYIHEEGPELLKKLYSFTGVDIRLPKMDMAAIPDFNAGAMENWGLTTYRERYLLYDEKVSSTKSKETITTVVAHELSHQWFGDFLTMKWWNYTWLNEGFATYYEYHIPHEVEPTWRMNELFVTEVLHSALSADGVSVHHAMTSPVTTLSEIKSKFDVISYDKGGSVLRMLQHILTLPIFKKCMKTYLLKRYIKNGLTTPKLLFSSIEEVLLQEKITLPVNITEVMCKMTEQPGYALINVFRKPHCSQHRNIEIEQITYKSPRSKKEISNRGWIVPLTCTKKSSLNFSNTKPTMWSHPNITILLKGEVGIEEWMLCNVQQTGYYRVNYDEENWNLLINQLHTNPTVIHPVNKAQLIDDSYVLATDNKIPFSTAINLLKYLRNETDLIPWQAALQNLKHLCSQYESTYVESHLKNFFLSLLRSIYKVVGFLKKVQDGHLTKTSRSAIVKYACELGHQDCINSAKEEYAKNKNLSDIDPDIKQTVFCTMLNGSEYKRVWDRMWELYRSSNVSYEKETVLLSLGCAKDEKLLISYLEKLLVDPEEDIRPQYVRYVITSVLSTPRGVNASLTFIKEIIENLDNYKNGQKVLITLASSMSSKLKSKQQMKLLEKLIENAKRLDQTRYGDLTYCLISTKQSAERSIKWAESRLGDVGAAFGVSEPSSANPKLPKPIIYMILFVAGFISTRMFSTI